MQVVSLGESHEDLIRASLVDARVAVALDRDPLNLGDDSLSVSCLFSVPSESVRNLTKGLDSDITEKFREIFPHERSNIVVLSVLIGSDLRPELFHLSFLAFGLVVIRLEVASVAHISGSLEAESIFFVS